MSYMFFYKENAVVTTEYSNVLIYQRKLVINDFKILLCTWYLPQRESVHILL